MKAEIRDLRVEVASRHSGVAKHVAEAVRAIERTDARRPPWTLSLAVEQRLFQVFDDRTAVDAVIARCARRVELDVRDTWSAFPSRSMSRAPFLNARGNVLALHLLMFEAQSRLVQEFVLPGGNYARRLYRLANSFDARAHEIEESLIQELELWRDERFETSESPALRLVDTLLKDLELPAERRSHLLEEGACAKTHAFETWCSRIDPVPARPLAELVLLQMRHAAMSAWEDDAAGVRF